MGLTKIFKEISFDAQTWNGLCVGSETKNKQTQIGIGLFQNRLLIGFKRIFHLLQRFKSISIAVRCAVATLAINHVSLKLRKKRAPIITQRSNVQQKREKKTNRNRLRYIYLDFSRVLTPFQPVQYSDIKIHRI